MWQNLSLLFQNPVALADLAVNGLMIGAIFVLVAYGMALVWGVMNIINICQGEFVILGGFVAFYFAKWGLNPLLGVPAAFVLLLVVGWLLYRAVIFRIVDRDLFTSILATFGISIFLSQTMNEIFTADVEIARHGLGSWTLLDGRITLEHIKLVAFALAMAIGLTLVVYMKNTRAGQASRATAQNARAARIMGIDTDAVYARTYALNAAICGAAGALVAMIFTIQAYGGLAYTIRGFLIVLAAGLGNLGGVIVAGLSLGAAEQIAGWVFGLEFQLAFIFGMLVLIVMYRQVRLGFQRQYLR